MNEGPAVLLFISAAAREAEAVGKRPIRVEMGPQPYEALVRLMEGELPERISGLPVRPVDFAPDYLNVVSV